jgi:hypothetical protein
VPLADAVVFSIGDNGGTGPVYAGLARLFRLLPNARGTDCSHPLGPPATAGCPLAGVRGELRNMAGSGRGPWHLARSKALSVGLSNAHFKSLGLPSLIDAR